MYTQRMHYDKKKTLNLYSKKNMLTKWDTIAAIALSKSIQATERNKETEINIKNNFAKIWLKIIFLESCFQWWFLNCPSIETRIHDFNQALLNPNIKWIINVRGGRNSNQILPYLNYNIIRKNPKPIIWFSDITAILNAIYAKTNIKTIHGPMLTTSFFKKDCNNFTLKQLEKILFQQEDVFINSQDSRVIQEWNKSWFAIGGNLTTFQHLFGSKYIPKLKKTILFLEDTQDVRINSRDRAITALSFQKNANKIQWFLIGKSLINKGITKENLQKIFKKISIRESIPILANLNFGHIDNNFSFQIGGKIQINSKTKTIIVKK